MGLEEIVSKRVNAPYRVWPFAWLDQDKKPGLPGEATRGARAVATASCAGCHASACHRQYRSQENFSTLATEVRSSSSFPVNLALKITNPPVDFTLRRLAR
jgi:hypothetical protein